MHEDGVLQGIVHTHTHTLNFSASQTICSAPCLIGCQGVGESARFHGDDGGDLRGLDDPGRMSGPVSPHNTQLHCAG